MFVIIGFSGLISIASPEGLKFSLQHPSAPYFQEKQATVVVARKMYYDVFMANKKRNPRRLAKTGTQEPVAKPNTVSGCSSSFLMSDSIETYVSDQERMLAEVRQADRQLKSGHYIRHEDIRAWLLSWGTGHEMQPPKCACGKEHDDETLCR